MTLLIADTFTDSLARLTGEEQKAVKTTAFDLQLNPSSPGLSFHKLDRAKDKNFWSVRVNRDVRIIVHRTDDSMLLCYVDHHDKSYAWAERRKLTVHPITGAAQLVEVRESVVDITIPNYIETPAVLYPAPGSSKPLFANVAESQLLSYGVPSEWMPDVRSATEDSIFTIIAHLPAEAAEALLELATGGTPRTRMEPVPADNPFEHPDAKRRFRVMTNVDELERALDYPWEKWSVFLHPAQRDLVKRSFSGPARVAGSAGTGKTVVALHRAVSLARGNPGKRVLLTTFSITLARMLRQKLARLVGTDADLAAQIHVEAIDEAALTLYEEEFGTPRLATPTMIDGVIREASESIGGHSFQVRFLRQEWTDVVDAWQLHDWDAYREVARLGRKSRLSEKQRAAIWPVFQTVMSRLESGAVKTTAGIFAELSSHYSVSAAPYDFVVVDEAQDVNVSQLRFLAALAGNRTNALFFAGDLGQRIFQTPFSWKSVGVDIRGRSHTLRVNYRTSHQIRAQADRLLGTEVSDVDGITESRDGTVSVFNGAEPTVVLTRDTESETNAIASWLMQRVLDGLSPDEIGVFVRSRNEVERAMAGIRAAGLQATSPQPGVDPVPGHVMLMPMHLAKGLEFRAVVVAACDEGVLPLEQRLESVTDESDLEDVYNTERQLLYVACTRARDHLLITAVAPGSEFLRDFAG